MLINRLKGYVQKKPLLKTILLLPYRIIKQIYQKLIIIVNRFVEKKSLNIGGGPNFHFIGWINLDEVPGKSGVESFRFTSESMFPIKDKSIKKVYSSHCLEHLDNETVMRVLGESFRVLKNNGSMIIKLPNYDLILEKWKNKDVSFFANDVWDYQSIVGTWKSRDIEDNLDNRTAVLFCGFWNDDYGDHFSMNRLKNEAAYHGPPKTDKNYLNKLLEEETPSIISSELSRIVIKNEKNVCFNHRSAWSREEFKKVLEKIGFNEISFEKNVILSEFNSIPGIKEMESVSMYFSAKKG